jgi:hypothetical protein
MYWVRQLVAAGFTAHTARRVLPVCYHPLKKFRDYQKIGFGTSKLCKLHPIPPDFAWLTPRQRKDVDTHSQAKEIKSFTYKRHLGDPVEVF